MANLGLVVAIVAVGVALPASPADAATGLLVRPNFPDTVTVGQVAVPASIEVEHFRPAPRQSAILTLNEIRLISSCSKTSEGCVGGIADRANTIAGTLACAGNNPAPVNAGRPNTAAGGKTGQCAALGEC